MNFEFVDSRLSVTASLHMNAEDNVELKMFSLSFSEYLF